MNNEITLTWAQLQPALPEIYLTAALCVLLIYFLRRAVG